ncbi:MAG: CCA tRNA nucleotidyltransferase [Candidatus Solibacter usitatus]|nr:CCA tRNA nucleotidyltransferase [Candidatus Solibacter usitatus]
MRKSSEADLRGHASRIVFTLREAGFQAYLVGGCVRDELMGNAPKDYDVATSALPQQVLALFPDSGTVGAHFGVVLVRAGRAQVEVATFRSDAGYSDGRHPDAVSFELTPRKDALRRDFTINAVFLDPFTGEVLDFVGGRNDMRDAVIRAIGDPRARFEEDRLRMLRAVRFAARFGFDIEPGTLHAIREMRALIHTVAAERIRDELFRILTEGQARRGFQLLDECGLLAEILPEVKAFQGVEQPPEFHPEGDVWTHVMLMLEQMGKAGTHLALGVLLHDAGKPATFRVADRIRFDGHVEKGVEIARGILSRFRCSGDQMDSVTALVANHMRFMDVPKMKPSTLKRFLRLPDFEDHLELHRLDCLSSNRDLRTYHHVREILGQMPAEVLRPEPLLTGRDLIEAGFPPGPQFKKVLRAVEDAQLDGSIRTKEEALQLVRSLN